MCAGRNFEVKGIHVHKSEYITIMHYYSRYNKLSCITNIAHIVDHRRDNSLTEVTAYSRYVSVATEPVKLGAGLAHREVPHLRARREGEESRGLPRLQPSLLHPLRSHGGCRRRGGREGLEEWRRRVEG